MKILAIHGSPRKKGITSKISQAFLDQAEQKGAEIQSFHLNDMVFQGCQGCHLCKTKFESCVLKDDLTPVLAGIQASDILVLASPIYFWDVTGQFKSFFDRTWSLVKPDYQTNPHPVRMDSGKKAVWISSQGDAEEKFKDMVHKYTGFLAMFGCETHSIRAFGMQDAPDQEINAYLAMARNLATEIMG